MARVTQLQARLAASELQLIPLVAAVDVAKAAVTTTQRAFSTARRAATKATKAASASCTKSAIAKALDWKPEEQALTEKLSAIATRDVALYAGKEARIGSGQSIVLETDNLLTMQKAKITVESEIELTVGLFTITVKKNKILINNGVTDVVTVDAKGAVIDSGNGSSIKVGSGKIDITAATKAQISASGKIVLG
ncbi:MAG: hypothetical protein NVSMB47_02630 [Polyangiales bacterium]